MWPRTQLHIGWLDLAWGLCQSLLPARRDRLVAKLESLWAPAGDGLATLSVRSSLDLVLSALALPPGSEVLMTAITIDEMRQVVAAHGLVAVPVDLDPADMAPSREALRRAGSPRTRAIVVAHLFGGRVDLEPILAWARPRGIVVIEDCAQAFAGPGWRGDPRSDVAMFSFGSIKTSTALGGALLRVTDRRLLSAIRSRQARWPVASRGRYAAKTVKYAFLKLLAWPPVFSAFVAACRALRSDYNQLLSRWVRGFARANLLDCLRHQPSPPLLALLCRRLERCDAERIARRAAKGELLSQSLGGGVTVLGDRALNHTHWVVPIACSDPPQVIADLVAAGFDAHRAGSMTAIPAPADRPELTPAEAIDALAQLVYLPCYAEMPDSELQRMARIVNESVRGDRASQPSGRPAAGAALEVK